MITQIVRPWLYADSPHTGTLAYAGRFCRRMTPPTDKMSHNPGWHIICSNGIIRTNKECKIIVATFATSLIHAK